MRRTKVVPVKDHKSMRRSGLRFIRLVKKEMRAAGLNPSSAARLLGYNAIEMSQILSMVKKTPPIHRLEQWALVLDIDRDTIYSWADRVPPEVIAILSKHPMLCKKIRERGVWLLTPEERRLDKDLYDGRKRSP